MTTRHSDRQLDPPAEPAGGEPPRPRQPSDLVADHVRATVHRLMGGYLAAGGPTSEATRTLALLRRSLGAAGGADPRMWALVLKGMPAELMGHGTLATPTRAETAVLTATTLYAVHQQSQRDPMHVNGVGLGDAIRRVAQQRARPDSPGGLDDATVQRMHRVSMAQTQELRAQALRALVTLMRAGSPPVPLDYGQLARDLYWLQFHESAPRVHLAWGRQLHTHRNDSTTQHDGTDQTGDQP